jgi:hypothetical protein
MTREPSPVWKVILDYLADREQFEPAAARLAVALKDTESPPFPAIDPGEKRLRGHMVWVPLDPVPEADRPRAAALLKRAFAIIEDGEAA